MKIYENEHGVLYRGDCLEVMQEMQEKSVDMVITSPPYDNLREYEKSCEWNEDIWKAIIKEIYKVLKEGGVCVWVVGDATVDGSETGTSFKQALYAKEIGFNIHDTMIYNKNCSPQIGGNNKYGCSYEFMFVFSKGAPKTVNIIKDRKNITAGKKITAGKRKKSGEWIKSSTYGNIRAEYGRRFNIWDITPKASNGHPAPFPIKLATDHIRSWSSEGDVILDPFGGSGTTAIASMDLKRKFKIIEKVESYCKKIINRLENWQPILF